MLEFRVQVLRLRVKVHRVWGLGGILSPTP